MNTNQFDSMLMEGNAQHKKWEPISDNKAWSLCAKEGKAAPYAGYICQLDKALIRCTRGPEGHKYEISHIN